MSKICIICVYLGNLPDTYTLWRRSVKWNRSIDFLLITDARVCNVPANLKVINMTLPEIKQMAEQELGMKITMETPYKLCDYKPVYGAIFRRFLNGYDYWGHCDMDLIFGDLKKFFKEYHLYRYDKFLHQGHLALYRNTDKIVSAYKLPGSYYSYKTVFSSNDSFVFDEFNRINSIFHHNKLRIFERTIFANINPAFTRFKCCNLKNYKKQLFYYDSGKVYRAFKARHGKVEYQDFIYIHLLKRKLGAASQEVLDADRFAITENGYYVLNRIPDSEIINEYTKNQDMKVEVAETVTNFRKNWLSISELKARLTIAIWKIGILRRILIRVKNRK